MSEVMTRRSADRRPPEASGPEPSLSILLDLAQDHSAEDNAFAKALVQAESRAAARAAALAERAELANEAAAAQAVNRAHRTPGSDLPRGKHAAPAARRDGVTIPLLVPTLEATNQPRHTSRHATPRPAVSLGVATPVGGPATALPLTPPPATELVRAETRRSRRRALPVRSGLKHPAVAVLTLAGILAAAQASASEGPSVVNAVAKAAARASTGADLTAEGPSRSGTREGMPAADSQPAAGTGVQATAQLSVAGEQALERAAVVAGEAEARAAAVAAAATKAAADAAAAAEAARRLVAPMDARMVSGFGYRVDPFGWGTSMHEGLDYASGCGAEIHAASAGTVVESGWMGGYGWRVVVDHGVIDGHALLSTYNHMGQPGVGVGTVVEKGTIVGYVGSTGASTGCHLHFEIKQDGVLVDPLTILPAS